VNFSKYLNEDILSDLYALQNSTVEHKFPIRYGFMYFFEMAAGDIFREMTVYPPSYGYVFEKIERLKQFHYMNDVDVREELVAKKELDMQRYLLYKAALSNLTTQTHNHAAEYADRFPIMSGALVVLHRLTTWFESQALKDKEPVIVAINALEKEINKFFKSKRKPRVY
jgi:hypothetical protein